MVVALSSLRESQTVTVSREGKYLGFGKIVELKQGHIVLVDEQRGRKLTQRITLDGQEQYLLHR